jgi:hypothetical protein
MRRKSPRAVLALGLGAGLLALSVFGARPACAVNDFAVAADHWLALVDAGRYAESWREAGSFLRSSIPEAQWVAELAELRRRAGRNLARELAVKDYATGVEDGPRGHVFVLKHRSAFENIPDAVETVSTIYEEESGAWRVIGYSVQKRAGDTP